MSLETELQACLDAIEGCTAAALVDLDSGMMLTHQPRAALTPEASDALAATAAELLGRPVPPALEEAGIGRFDHALVAGAGSLHVFQRLPGEAERALCLVFGADVAPEAALQGAKARQDALAGAGLW